VKRIAACCLALCLASACAQRRMESERCAPADAGTPVDAVLLAFLSRARAAHHLADERESVRDTAGAIASLSELVSGPLPHTSHGELAPEVREVLADSLARLADLQSQQAAFEPALASIQRGLGYATEPNYFRGHLLETEGLVEERRAHALETKDPTGAQAAKQRAIALLEEAMTVQAGVIKGATPLAASAAIPAASAAPH